MAESEEVKVSQDEQHEEKEIVKIAKKIVQYCQVCSLPPEYCSYQSNTKVRKCQEWLKINNPALYVKYYVEPEQKKEQAEGGTKEGEQPAEENKENTQKPSTEIKKDPSEEVQLTALQLEKLDITFDLSKKMELQGGDNKITILTTRRKFKKFVTVVTGLSKYGIRSQIFELVGQFVFQTNLGVNLKDAAKRFRHKFACGSKEEGEEIEIQGEVDDVIGEFIVKEWKHINPNVFVFKKESAPKK